MKQLAFIATLLLISCASTQRNPIIKADTEDCKSVYANIVNIAAKDIATYPTAAENDALRKLMDNQFHASGDYQRFMASCNRDMSVEQSICGSHAQTLETVSSCMKMLPSAKQER